jgi:glutaredoxin-related protein
MNITVYSKDNCPFCDMAKNWFKSKGYEFTEHRIGHNGFTREMLLEAVPTARTVPQIVIDEKLIGGWDDLRKSELYANANQG